MRIMLGACLALLLTTTVRADIDPALREEGVLYFEDNLPNRIVAVVKVPTTLFLRRDFASPLAGFDPGSKLELVGMSPEGYLVKGEYRNNVVTGWIRPGDLPPGVDPKLLAAARKNQARSKVIAEAIDHKAVVEGMTPDEVRASVGRPEQTSSHEDANGSILTWVYTTYADELQYSYGPGYLNRYGGLQSYYVKVPVGQLIVNFADGAVISVDQKKTDPSSPGVVTN